MPPHLSTKPSTCWSCSIIRKKKKKTAWHQSACPYNLGFNLMFDAILFSNCFTAFLVAHLGWWLARVYAECALGVSISRHTRNENQLPAFRVSEGVRDRSCKRGPVIKRTAQQPKTPNYYYCWRETDCQFCVDNRVIFAPITNSQVWICQNVWLCEQTFWQRRKIVVNPRRERCNLLQKWSQLREPICQIPFKRQELRPSVCSRLLLKTSRVTTRIGENHNSKIWWVHSCINIRCGVSDNEQFSTGLKCITVHCLRIMLLTPKR